MSRSDLRRWSMVGLLAVAVPAASCGQATEPRESQELVHAVASSQLILTNKSDKPVFYFVVEQSLVPAINWIACDDPSICSSLAPGEGMHIEFEHITGYHMGSERAVLYWWFAKGARDGVQSFERVRQTTIQLW